MNFSALRRNLLVGSLGLALSAGLIGQAVAGEQLQQIKDKGYADKYRAEGLPIHLIGVEFSREQRSVVGFEVETLLS